MYILSPGADPHDDIEKLCDSLNEGNKNATKQFKYLSLGQGMGDAAAMMIKQGTQKGHWVLLENCHLLTSWLKTLEVIIEQLESKNAKPDPNFRLWLTTAPTDAFPLGILQRALKVVTEPPDGLRLNMTSSYSKLSEADLNQCTHEAYKSLVYVLSFFHAIVQDRRKFGKIGWNITYAFNESEFRISKDLIVLYLNKAIEFKQETLPW